MSYLCGANLRINDMTSELFLIYIFIIGVLLLIGRIIALIERMSKKLLSVREDLEKQNDEIKRLHLTLSEIEGEYLLSELRRRNTPSENISKK